MPRSATPIHGVCRSCRARRFEVLDFYATRRPACVSAILSWFRPKEVSFFRENMMRSARSCCSKAAFFFFDQDLALSGVIRLADNAFQFHPLHQRGGAVISDLQPALDVAGRGLAVALDDRHRLREQVAAAFGAHAGGIEHRAVFVDRLFGGDRLEVFGLALGLKMADHLFYIFVGDEWSVHAADAAAAR